MRARRESPMARVRIITVSKAITPSWNASPVRSVIRKFSSLSCQGKTSGDRPGEGSGGQSKARAARRATGSAMLSAVQVRGDAARGGLVEGGGRLDRVLMGSPRDFWAPAVRGQRGETPAGRVPGRQSRRVPVSVPVLSRVDRDSGPYDSGTSDRPTMHV